MKIGSVCEGLNQTDGAIHPIPFDVIGGTVAVILFHLLT